MALNRVDLGIQYFPQFAADRAIANAQIYIGQPNLDPAVLANQIQAYVVQENGTQVAVPQPIRTGAGGVPTYNGSPVQIGVSESQYSLKVLTSTGSQIYYQPDNTDLAIVNAAQVTYNPAGTGAVATTVERKLQENLHIGDYGGFAGASAAVNTAALNDAITEALLKGKAGVEIGPGGTWEFTAGTNFAARDIAIIGVGKPILDYSSGSGVGFKIDAGGSGAFVRGMRVENFIVKGGPSITDIFYLRGVAACQFKNIEVREGTDTGFAILSSVLCTYEDCRVSNDSLAMTTTPLIYWKLDNDGTLGTRTQANTFINCDASGVGNASVSDGWRLIDSTLNTWIGGTSESVSKGINIVSDECRLNTWIGFDLEDNNVHDAVILGTSNRFENCLFVSVTSQANISIQTGKGTVFSGGYLRWIDLTATSSDTSFFGCGIDENLSGTLGIQGPGSYKSVGSTKIDGTGLVVGEIQDFVGNNGSWTPTDASGAGLVFSNATGAWTRIGKLVFAQGAITYPSTANATPASIGGLPFLVANLNTARQGFVSFTDEPTVFSILPDALALTMSIRDSSGNSLTNATMSLNTIWFTAIYSIA